MICYETMAACMHLKLSKIENQKIVVYSMLELMKMKSVEYQKCAVAPTKALILKNKQQIFLYYNRC